MRGQAENIERLGFDAASLDASLNAIQTSDDYAEIALAESAAAESYWRQWRGLPIRFTKADTRKIPTHWHSFTARVSPLTGSPRLASDPINAILNYLYAILEAETTLCCRAIGLDPTLGILHRDQGARPSLSLDLMEPGRPHVDRYVLALLNRQTLTRTQFQEERDGRVRVADSLAKTLIQTSHQWRAVIAPHVEHTARLLARSAGLRASPTLLTGEARSKARPVRNPRDRRMLFPYPVNHCLDCGTRVPEERMRCTQCAHDHNEARLSEHRTERWNRVRDGAHDASHGADAARKRGDAIRAKHAQRLAYERATTGKPQPRIEQFQTDYLPQIAGLSPTILATRSGLSAGFIRHVRAGRRVPHPVHWDALVTPHPRETLDAVND